LRQRHHERFVGSGLRHSGVSFKHHYPIAAASAPSRAAVLTDHYPSLHAAPQTDRLAKDGDNSDETFWPAPDAASLAFAPAGTARINSKWQASHAHLEPRTVRASAVDRRRQQAAARDHRRLLAARERLPATADTLTRREAVAASTSPARPHAGGVGKSRRQDLVRRPRLLWAQGGLVAVRRLRGDG
jgi:hypothetical protein